MNVSRNKSLASTELSFRNLGFAAFILGQLSGVVGSDRAWGGESIRPLLTGYEWRLDAGSWTGLQNDPSSELIAIVQHPQEAPYIKARAIAVLSLYPNQPVWNLFLETLEQGQQISRRRVVDAMCDAFISDRPDKLESLLVDYLEESDAHLRIRVARCLTVLGTISAMQAVKRYRLRLAETNQEWELNALDALQLPRH